MAGQVACIDQADTSPSRIARIRTTYSRMTELKSGSIVYLAEPGYRGEGYYAINDWDDDPEIRVIQRLGGRVWVTTLNGPKHTDEMTAADLSRLTVRRVLGITMPVTSHFVEFIEEMFERFRQGR